MKKIVKKMTMEEKANRKATETLLIGVDDWKVCWRVYYISNHSGYQELMYLYAKSKEQATKLAENRYHVRVVFVY